MKKNFIILCWLMISIHSPALTRYKAVIPRYNHGRLGDHLICVAHSLYFSMKHNYKMLYVPFNYSDQLVLDDIVEKYSADNAKKFDQTLVFTSPKSFPQPTGKNNLVIIPYFRDDELYFFYKENKKPAPPFIVDWKNKSFLEMLNKIFAPKNPQPLIAPRNDAFSIAVHLRTGGAFDTWKNKGPTYINYKAPLIEFYAMQIKKIAQLVGNIPIYAFIFTDDENPQQKALELEQLVNLPQITFDYRRQNNHHDSNVLEDFYSMMHFDALIRPSSNFSFIAEKMGHHKIVISPGPFIEGSFVQEGIIKINNLETSGSQETSA